MTTLTPRYSGDIGPWYDGEPSSDGRTPRARERVGYGRRCTPKSILRSDAVSTANGNHEGLRNISWKVRT